MVGYIYKWENKINGKVYIGQTMNRYGYKERWSQHRYYALNGDHNNHFYRAIKKYGYDGFNKSILEIIEMDDKIELKNVLDELEIKYIEKYDSFNNGYNSTMGGDFNIFSSGGEHDKEKAILNLQSTRARNQIYNAIKIKTEYRLPKDIESLHELYDEWDINGCEYRYKYVYRKHWKSKHRHKDIGRTIGDRGVSVYSLDYIGWDCIDNNGLNIEEYYGDFDIDMFDEDIVKKMICIPVESRYKYGVVGIDMDIIDNMICGIISDRHWCILDMLRMGFTQQSIADKLKCSRSVINKQLDRIVKKITEVYEKEYAYKYYYLNVVKGKYKKCFVCGEIKMVSEYHKDSRGKDGYKCKCKYCSANYKNTKVA